MNKNKALLQTEYERPIRKLRVVFSTFISRCLTLLLMSTFVLQPLARALASEEVAVAELPPAVSLTSAVPTESPPLKSPESEASSSMETSPPKEEVTSQVQPIEPATPIADAYSSSSVDVELPLITDSASVTDPGTLTVVPEGQTTGTLAEEPVQEIVPDETLGATTTNPSVAVLTVESDSVVQFDKSECVAVSDGSFYCQPKKTEPLKPDDGMYAYPDSDGDLEIYLKRNGELKQITFNTTDDAAPYYDSVSNTIVWHKQISERYQIMSYDIDTGTETQLTSDTVNNMEPSRVGQYTAWQRWSGDNWDIVMFDGKETTVLTTALEHDIAPQIRGSLVVWNRIGKDQAQTIEIYDIQTGEYTTINDSEGGVISNPRMVLVYESSFENGDVVTKGYDMQTGEIADLSATPTPVPDDIPPPDDTGETRALIQGKSPTKEDLEQYGSTTPKIGYNPEPEPDPQVTGTSTSTSTIIINSTSTTPVVIVEVASTSSLNFTIDMVPKAAPVNEFELVIPPFVPLVESI